MNTDSRVHGKNNISIHDIVFALIMSTSMILTILKQNVNKTIKNILTRELSHEDIV